MGLELLGQLEYGFGQDNQERDQTVTKIIQYLVHIIKLFLIESVLLYSFNLRTMNGNQNRRLVLSTWLSGGKERWRWLGKRCLAKAGVESRRSECT